MMIQGRDIIACTTDEHSSYLVSLALPDVRPQASAEPS